MHVVYRQIQSLNIHNFPFMPNISTAKKCGDIEEETFFLKYNVTNSYIDKDF